jgi:hypothetical protein
MLSSNSDIIQLDNISMSFDSNIKLVFNSFDKIEMANCSNEHLLNMALIQHDPIC